MSTIVELQQRAAALKAKYQKESITPEEIGQLHEDTLAYMADLERYVDNLGVRKTYASKAEMDADVAPVGTNGKAMRYGQLAVIRSTDADNGNIYAWQKPGWLLVGNLNEGQVVNDLVTGGSNVPLSAEQGKVLDGKIEAAVGSIPAVVDNLSTDDATKALSAKQGKTLFEMATEYDVSAHNNGKAYTLSGTAQVVRLFVRYAPQHDGDIVISLGGNVFTVTLSATGHNTPALVAAAIAAATYSGYSVSYTPGNDYVDFVADSVGAKVAPGIDQGTTGAVITIEETTAGADSAVAAVPAWFQKGSLVLKFLSAVSGNYERYYNSSTGWSANINLWTPIFDGKFIPILFRKGGFAYADAQWYTKFNYVDNRLCSQGFAACDIIVNIPDGYMMACITGTIGRPATNANWERGRLVIRKDMGHVRLLLKRTDETSVPDMLDIDSMPLSFYDELNHEGLSQSLEDLSKVVLSHALVLHQGSVNTKRGLCPRQWQTGSTLTLSLEDIASKSMTVT